MASLRPYLHLDGTTRQAMEFYKEVLGGELEIQTVGETPWASSMPAMPGATPDKVMHSMLKKGDTIIMAADMMDPSSFTKGDNVSLCLVCDSKNEIETIYKKLSAGGDVFMALDKAPFGWYAQFTDKFGIDWMLQAEADK